MRSSLSVSEPFIKTERHIMAKRVIIAPIRWYKTRTSLAMFGVIELAVAYGFASLAIDRGSWWWYGLTLLFFIGALRNFVKLIGWLTHVKSR